MDKFVERQEVLKLLNAPTPEERLANLAILLGSEKEKPEVKPQFANNHIHTIYSFSPVFAYGSGVLRPGRRTSDCGNHGSRQYCRSRGIPESR